MEWLLKIVDLFKREPRDGIRIIHLNDLKEWLDLQTQEILTSSNLDQDLKDYLAKIKEKRQFLEYKAEEWQKKITYFNKNKFEINLFFQATRKLLNLLIFENENLESVLGLNSVFEPKLKKLIHAVEGNEFAQNFGFLLDEKEETIMVNPLLKELLELDGLIRGFERKVTQCGYRKIETLKKKIFLLNDQTIQLHQTEEELNHKQAKLFDTKNKVGEKKSDLQKVKEDPEYLSQEMINREKEEIIRQIDDNKDKIFSFFSKLKPLLLEYKEFGFKRSLIDSYIENSVEAFFNDDSLLIRHALEHMKAILSSGKFTLSFKDANSILDTLENGEDNLEEIQKKNLKLSKELERFDELLQNKNLSLKVEDTNYRLEHFSEQIEKLGETILSLEEKTAELKERRDQEIELFQNLVRIGLGKNISVSF